MPVAAYLHKCVHLTHRKFNQNDIITFPQLHVATGDVVGTIQTPREYEEERLKFQKA